MTLDVKIVPFEQKHFDEINLRQSDFANFDKDKIKEIVKELSQDNAFTLLIKDRVILFGGIYSLHKKAGEAWLVCAEEIKYYPRTSARTVKRHILNMMETLDLSRLQTKNNVNELHNRWVEWVGFQKEGILRKFDELGNDIIMYSIVR